MGNAGSNNMHRERHKSTDLSTPNTPFRELPMSTRDAVSTQRSVDSNASSSGAQAFTFDKKPDTCSVLNGGSSIEDEEQPYYTKPVGLLAKTTTTTTTTTANKTAAIERNIEFDTTGGGGGGNKRKRASNNSKGATSIDEMSAKGSTESNEEIEKRRDDDDDQSATEDSSGKIVDENKNPALPTVLRWDGGGRNVMISGTFSKWKPIPMVRSHGNFVTIIDLPMGDHQYKFCVDGDWKHDPKLQPCKACSLLEGLNRGLPRLGIGKKSKGERMIKEQDRELALRERAHLVKNDF